MQDPSRQRLRHAHHHLAVWEPREEEGGRYLGQVRRECTRRGADEALIMEMTAWIAKCSQALLLVVTVWMARWSRQSEVEQSRTRFLFVLALLTVAAAMVEEVGQDILTLLVQSLALRSINFGVSSAPA